MTIEYDGGIVRGYLTEFMQLGMKSHGGEDVSSQVPALVDKAFGHMDIWVSGTPESNKAKLTGELKRTGQLAATSSPAQAKVLMDAHALAFAKLNGRG